MNINDMTYMTYKVTEAQKGGKYSEIIISYFVRSCKSFANSTVDTFLKKKPTD